MALPSQLGDQTASVRVSAGAPAGDGFVAFASPKSSTFSPDRVSILDTVLPPWSPGVLDIHHINTGKGDSAFFILPDGTTLLVDAGATLRPGPGVTDPRRAPGPGGCGRRQSSGCPGCGGCEPYSNGQNLNRMEGPP